MTLRTRLISFAAGAGLLASFTSIVPLAQANILGTEGNNTTTAPLPNSSASLTAAQISAITSLLQSFGADPSAIAKVQGVLSGTPSMGMMGSTTPPTKKPLYYDSVGSPLPPTRCAVILGNLKRGSSGEEVMRLQAFLGATTTGFFGPQTEVAVQKWQAEHGVATGGTPLSNGFGALGPKTRALLNSELKGKCGGDMMMGSTTMIKPPKPDASTTPMHGQGFEPKRF